MLPFVKLRINWLSMTKNFIVSAAPPRRGNACESFVFILLWFMIGFWFLAIALSLPKGTQGGYFLLRQFIVNEQPTFFHITNRCI